MGRAGHLASRAGGPSRGGVGSRMWSGRVVGPRLRLGISMALGACGLAACGADRGSTAPRAAPASVERVAGHLQTGTAGDTLAQRLVIRVLDAQGTPIAGARVAWRADHGGTMRPALATTDPGGRAHAVWTLGEEPGEHEATATLAGLTPVRFAAHARARELPLDTIRVLRLATYDGSGQVVHPDVTTTPVGWGSARAHLVITPYPFGSAAEENPSVFTGPDGLQWTVPAGVINPIARPEAGEYLSDPDQVFVPEAGTAGELWIYYRAVTTSFGEAADSAGSAEGGPGGSANVIRRISSGDGIRWSTPAEVVRVPAHGLISPAVVRRGPGDWWMWAVNGGTGCTAPRARVELRSSSDGLHWSAPRRAELVQPGFFPWHVDVSWVPSRGEFWALYNVKTAGSCTTPAVYLATSADGVRWTTYPSPVLARGMVRQFADVVYRSSLAYDAAADAITFWFSGASYESGRYRWSVAVQRRQRADVFARIAEPSPRPQVTHAPALAARQAP